MASGATSRRTTSAIRQTDFIFRTQVIAVNQIVSKR